MATLNYYTPYTYNGRQDAQYRIQVQLVESQNVANNQTTLTCTAYFRPYSSSSGYAFNSGNSFTLTVNGVTLFNGNPGRVAANAQIGSSWSTTVTHNANGTKSVTVAVYYNQTQDSGLTINASGSVTLTPIVRYTKIYVNSAWKRAIPWIYVGGTWKRAIPWVYNGSTWKVAGVGS